MVDGQERLTEGWEWYSISMNIGEIGHVAFRSPDQFHLYICLTQNIKQISARINQTQRLAAYDEAFRSRFIPAVEGLIDRFGMDLVPFDIRVALDSILHHLGLPAVSWPARIEVPNHVGVSLTF